MTQINYRVGIQQRVLPSYRASFFEMLANACPKGLSIFSGLPRSGEGLDICQPLKLVDFAHAQNHHILSGPCYMCWQSGFIPWLEYWQPHVLIVESNPRYLRTLAAVRWMHKRKRPVLGWGLGTQLGDNLFSNLRTTRWRHFVKQFDAMIAYSQQGAEQYQALGLPKERIFIAPNAVTPQPQYSLPERSQFYLSGNPIILFVGRLQERKRVDLLIHACAALQPEFQPELWIVGDGRIRDDLEKIARKEYPHTVFYGALHGDELNAIFSKADLFVLPGTGGLAVQQAMSFGLPVLVAEADGTQSNLICSDNGWIIPPANLSALTDHLRLALSDSLLLRRMGQKSYEIVKQEINIDKMVEVFAYAIQFVMGD